MILLAAIAMTTLTTQANNLETDRVTVVAMEVDTPAPTDVNTTEEGATEVKYNNLSCMLQLPLM